MTDGPSVLERISSGGVEPRDLLRIPTQIIWAGVLVLMIWTWGTNMLHDGQGDWPLMIAAVAIPPAAMVAFIATLKLFARITRRAPGPDGDQAAPGSLRAGLGWFGLWSGFATLQFSPPVLRALISGDWSQIGSGILWTVGGLALLIVLTLLVSLVRKADGSDQPAVPGGPLNLSS